MLIRIDHNLFSDFAKLLFALFREPTKQQPERPGDIVGRDAAGNERTKARLKFLQPLQRLLKLRPPALHDLNLMARLLDQPDFNHTRQPLVMCVTRAQGS